MRSRMLRILALAVCLGLLPAAADAKGGKGGGPPADKGRNSSGQSVQEKDKHHDDDRDDHHAGRGHGHEHEAAAGPSNRPSGWDKGNKTGWGDCNVPPGLAKQRGCDSHGLSARERAAHSNRKVATRSATASTSKAAQPGQTRGIILQRNASTARTTTATTTTAPKATQAGQKGGIILQKGATKPATQTRTAERK
jgi:hypothetical protein